jgi:hypothetical protein
MSLKRWVGRVGGLSYLGTMEKPQLTELDYQIAAHELSTGVAEIRTVAHVESKGAGFLPDGQHVTILLERHIFSRETKGRFDKAHPDISNPIPGGYGAAGLNQWKRFNKAFALDPQAAMKSASWGKWQIMGFNHKACGFETVGEFVDAMKSGEPAQLAAFVSFIKSNRKLLKALQGRRWAAFASIYNGPNYQINAYDTKLAAAYKKFSEVPEMNFAVTIPPLTTTNG